MPGAKDTKDTKDFKDFKDTGSRKLLPPMSLPAALFAVLPEALLGRMGRLAK